ncbi:MAG: transposase, partial [Minisyncoccia bacterium]
AWAAFQDKVENFKPWHVKWKGKGEDRVINQIPATYEGLRRNDTVLMQLGGSGDRLASAMARTLMPIGGMVCRVPPHVTKTRKGDRDMNDNDVLLELWEQDSDAFYIVDEPELRRIAVREAFDNRREAQLARMGCQQRLLQREIGKIFIGGLLKREIALVDSFDALHANSPILDALIKEEAVATRLLEQAVKASRPWALFEPIEGVGPAIAGALIASIGDVKRFPTYQKLMAFCGIHPLTRDGQKFGQGAVRENGDSIFPRRRRNQVSNWNQPAKQALYLLGDQINRRPESYWGAKLIENKASLRVAHPEVVIQDGKKRYTNGHIHKMAIWKTLRQFVRWMYRAWMNLENGKPIVFPKRKEDTASNLAKAA